MFPAKAEEARLSSYPFFQSHLATQFSAQRISFRVACSSEPCL